MFAKPLAYPFASHVIFYRYFLFGEELVEFGEDMALHSEFAFIVLSATNQGIARVD